MKKVRSKSYLELSAVGDRTKVSGLGSHHCHVILMRVSCDHEVVFITEERFPQSSEEGHSHPVPDTNLDKVGSYEPPKVEKSIL